MIVDAEEQRAFTRQQLDKMPVITSGLVLPDWSTQGGGYLVVDVVDGGKFWIQYSRDHHMYRCAEKKEHEATQYEIRFRPAR